MNSVILTGRLVKDPELTYTPKTQTAACRLTIAVDRPKRGDAQGDDYVRSADFIRVTVWDRQAETCDRYLAKGRQVAIHGRIQTGSYKNKDGQTVYTTDVVADRVEFLGSNSNERPAPTESYEKAPEKPRSRYEQAAIQEQLKDLPAEEMPDSFSAAEDDIPF